MATSRRPLTIVALSALWLTACGTHAPELKTVEQVDLDRFMGSWYVIASIPTFLEKKAYNAVETYSLNEDGTIDTVFTFNSGSFDGKEKRYTPTGFVLDTQSNARWGMRFVWPIKADYRIVFLSEDYSQTVIARQKRDFVWIMARSPSLPDADYRRLEEFVASIGYDTSKIRKVPQQPK